MDHPLDGRVDKIIQIVATSTTSWEHAARSAVDEAAKSIHNLGTARVVKADLLMRDGVTQFRIKLAMGFQLDRTRVDAAGLEVRVKRYLIIANQTLLSPGLEQLVHHKIAESPCEFHILVPQSAALAFHVDPSGPVDPTLRAVTESYAVAREEAHARLDSFRRLFDDVGDVLTAEVAVGDPVLATRRVMERSSFDEIIVSTLPPGISRWLRLDIPSRIERAFKVPVTSLIQEELTSN